jgi:hypothetical protein
VGLIVPGIIEAICVPNEIIVLTHYIVASYRENGESRWFGNPTWM